METTENNVTTPLISTDSTLPSQIVEVPKAKNYSKLLIVVVSSTLVIALSVFAYLRQKQLDTANSATPTPTVTEVVEVTPTPTETGYPEQAIIQTPITNKPISWKTIEDKNLGATFAMPSTFAVSQDGTTMDDIRYRLTSANKTVTVDIHEGYDELVLDDNYSPREDEYAKPLKWTINGVANTSAVNGSGDGMPCDETNKTFSYRGVTGHTWIVGKAITVGLDIVEHNDCGKPMNVASATDLATARKIIESVKLTKDVKVFVPTPTE